MNCQFSNLKLLFSCKFKESNNLGSYWFLKEKYFTNYTLLKQKTQYVIFLYVVKVVVIVYSV